VTFLGMTARTSVERTIALVVLILVAVWPLGFGTYYGHQILTQVFFVGIVAASVTFLSSYGGMISFAQIALFGISGFVYGNATTHDSKGLNLGLSPWLGILLAIGITVAVGLLFGALASRSSGIYFLMITLTFAVIANLFFGSVTDISGFGGISGINPPGLLLNGGGVHRSVAADALFYVALVAAVAIYVLIRYIVRTPFGIALQGVRDDPVRMASLGFNVPLHRTVAFGLGAFMASIAGILFVWWNGHIDPASIDLGQNINALLIAVIGGLARIEGAWIGAFAFYAVSNVIQNSWPSGIPGIGGTFFTIIGLIFLGVVVVSPDGLLGLWTRCGSLERLRRRGAPPTEAEPEAGA
jgi:branched-chain amino acid transport system permease protein